MPLVYPSSGYLEPEGNNQTDKPPHSAQAQEAGSFSPFGSISIYTRMYGGLSDDQAIRTLTLYSLSLSIRPGIVHHGAVPFDL
jgi:hypothetical protein